MQPTQLFHYSPEHRVVICTGCRYAVPPKAVSRHLKEIHHIYRSDRKSFVDFVQGLDLVDPEHVLLPEADQFPVPHLPIFNGLQCGFDGCGHLCLTEKRMRNHWALVKHEVADDNLTFQRVPVQTFFRGNNLHYFTGHVRRGNALDGGDNFTQAMHDRTVISTSDEAKRFPEQMIAPGSVRLAEGNISGLQSLELEHDAEFLLHHYQDSTSRTIATNADTEILWRDTVCQLAHEHDFLMFGILAVTSLHRAYLVPEQRKTYYLEASKYQDKAMGLFRTAVSNTTQENCHAVLVFTHLLVLYAWASEQQDDSLLLVTENDDDVIPSWLHFLRCGCVMLGDVWDFLESGPCKSLALALEAPFEGVDTLDEAAVLENLLSVIVQSSQCPWSDDVLETYREAASELALAFACSRSAQVFTTWDVLRIWPVRVSDKFMTLLKARHPAALILLAHYALLLERIESAWYFKGRATRLISSISRKLPLEWHQFIPKP
ncbi:hypothetical protein A1O1_00018 [Capronia coronata CBS 617.96]|uniref:C2H2-type domain-containing protein n=1 Tax=Capronia coronata CBS 617.96 TaxID=1182541 RepID=W9YZ08_9EURO|nr:uncharacterized protein A1O1_00018 [Capronia coronata CBS 617.96]EXJ94900.1 hypothetical protein A1O1_00018 [Capronia coronata CBS 617.96]